MQRPYDHLSEIDFIVGVVDLSSLYGGLRQKSRKADNGLEFPELYLS